MPSTNVAIRYFRRRMRPVVPEESIVSGPWTRTKRAGLRLVLGDVDPFTAVAAHSPIRQRATLRQRDTNLVLRLPRPGDKRL